jgi:hypothetical protein
LGAVPSTDYALCRFLVALLGSAEVENKKRYLVGARLANADDGMGVPDPLLSKLPFFMLVVFIASTSFPRRANLAMLLPQRKVNQSKARAMGPSQRTRRRVLATTQGQSTMANGKHWL